MPGVLRRDARARAGQRAVVSRTACRRSSTAIIDRYLLGLLWGPLALTLGTVLLVLLLARLLRLFDLVAASGAALQPVLLMLANLVPHYLGLALPAAFFASLFMVAARLGDNNELDALLASGRSIAQIAAPFTLLALLLSAFSVYLYGFLQPYSRYRYHVVRDEALHAGWNARVQQNMFADAGTGLVLTADQVDASGRVLQRVFILHTAADGTEEVTTARSGVLRPTEDGQRLLLDLADGRIVEERRNRSIDLTRFATATANESLVPQAPPFRARGDSERELTLPELWRQEHERTPATPPARLAGELQARLARAASLPLLPLLALPLGIAAKRGRRVPGVVVAALLMLMLHHGLQLGESFAESGRLPVLPAVWTPLAAFAAATLWLFWRTLSNPGENPVTRAVGLIESLIGGISLRRRPRTGKSSL
jgi:lipopolysaccharide export system permease protein